MNKYFCCLLFTICGMGVSPSSAQSITRQDSLRRFITPERAWWDIRHYDLAVTFDISNKKIKGSNTISFDVLTTYQVMQIDLQEPLSVTHASYRGTSLAVKKEGDVYWITFLSPLPAGTSDQVTIYYEGTPIEAVRPPWDGGITWSKDENGDPFVASSCQGIGASVWWPCKEHMYDEPDSMLIRITTPPSLTDVSNGRLRKIEYHPDGSRTWHWFISNPINNYGVNANIAKYTHWTDTLQGENGVLDLDFYVLEDHYEKARTHFDDVYKTLRAFEYWFGPYPFYSDGYKLIEVPYLGMEHQSSVTYGNKFMQGYLGRDLSTSGWGLKWDFIIVHETAHEWWANNITYEDIGDMWIHESFANYAESLFLDYHFGTKAGNEYVIGTRHNIENSSPIIDAHYNAPDSRDMYYKGGNMLHTLRTWLKDDGLFRNMLRGMQKEYYHKTVTSAQIENYMSTFTGKNLDPFFDQYLRDTRIPVLEYMIKGKSIRYRYANVVDGFAMPVDVSIDKGEMTRINPCENWEEIKTKNTPKSLQTDPNFYIHTKEVSKK